MTYSSRPLRALQGYHADLHTLLTSALQQLHHLGVLGPLAVLAVHRDDVVALLQPGFLQGGKKKEGALVFAHRCCSMRSARFPTHPSRSQSCRDTSCGEGWGLPSADSQSLITLMILQLLCCRGNARRLRISFAAARLDIQHAINCQPCDKSTSDSDSPTGVQGYRSPENKNQHLQALGKRSRLSKVLRTSSTIRKEQGSRYD